jgi:hypothetical protein
MYMMNVSFLIFHLPASFGCFSAYVDIERGVRVTMKSQLWYAPNDIVHEVYCGWRSPWHVFTSLEDPCIRMMYYESMALPRSFGFLIAYQAIDPQWLLTNQTVKRIISDIVLETTFPINPNTLGEQHISKYLYHFSVS